MHRRQFLLLAAALGAYPLWRAVRGLETSSERAVERKGLIIAGHTSEYAKATAPANYANYFLPEVAAQIAIFDVAAGRARRFDVPFYGHSFFQHPLEHELVAGCEKWGARAGAFHVGENKVARVFAPPPGHRFFGHGVFVPGGKQLIFSCSNNEDNEGWLAFYDWGSGMLDGLLPTHGRLPHDCFFTADGKTIVVGNSGSRSITYVDSASGKLKKKFQLSEEMNVSHLFPFSDTRLMFGSILREDKRVSWGLADTERGEVIDFSPLASESKFEMMGEALSLGALGPDLLYATTNMGAQLFFWDLKRNRAHSEKFPKSAWGVLRAGDSLYVSAGPDKLYRLRFNPETFQVEERVELGVAFGNASHMLMI